MCDRCKPLDRAIENFRRLYKMADDPLALFWIKEAIADIESEKAALHPPDKK
jgi:hypothetical protein